MNIFKMTDERRDNIRQQHKNATTAENNRKKNLENGLKKPEPIKKIVPKAAEVKKEVKPEKLHTKK